MDVSSRLPGLVRLAVVVVAAALLLAGLGVPVGAGVLVGLAVGLFVAFFVGARQPRGGIVTFGWRSRSAHAPDHEVVMRRGQAWMGVSAIEMSSLRHVIAVGMATDADGVRVELVALELRDDGGIAILVAHARPPAWIGHFLEVAVSDDVGTTYAAAGQSSGSPTPAVGRIDLRFAPAPPRAARRLTLRVDAFLDPFPGPARRLAGPWSFEVEVPKPGA